MSTVHKTAVCTPEPGQDLYNHVRAGFIAQGTNLHKWCREQGIAPQNARMALLGGWRGPAGRKMLARVTGASGVLESAV